MNVVDVVLGVAIVVFAITGWRRGFVFGLLSLAGFLVGAAVGFWLAPRLVESWQDGLTKALTALVIVFICAVAGQVIVGRAGRRFEGVVTVRPAATLNSAGGAVLSVLSILLVAWLAADLFAGTSRTSLARDVRQSELLGIVDQMVPMDAQEVTGELQSMFASTGFPEVFSGLGPEPVKPVSPPTSAIARQEGVVRAAAQTVKLVGRAPSCDATLSGSGFTYSPNRVMTNAHVVAGVRDPEVIVEGSGTSYDAMVVYFDPELDVAVLAVPDLPTKPVSFSLDVERNDSVAIIGYPEDDPLTATPGRVRDVQTAIGRDIYGDAKVVREIISMRAEVHPGNSGGPVVDKQGEVVGVVFASSLDSDDTGYALTAEEVAPAAAEGVTAVDEVRTGSCT